MGFSYKFYILDKDRFDSVTNLNLEQLTKLYPGDEDSEGIPFSLLDVFTRQEGVADLKLDSDYVKKILSSAKPAFKDKEVWDALIKIEEREGGIPYTIPKESFLYVIENAKKNLIDYLIEIKDCPTSTQMYLERKIDDWSENKYGMIPFNLDVNNKEIVHSYSGEYYIFELVRIYKEFAEPNQVLIIYGW